MSDPQHRPLSGSFPVFDRCGCGMHLKHGKNADVAQEGGNVLISPRASLNGIESDESSQVAKTLE